jgi:hypothetical protein
MNDLQHANGNPNRRAASLRLWSDPAYRERQAQTRSANRRKNSSTLKKLWQDPEYREKQTAAFKKARRK